MEMIEALGIAVTVVSLVWFFTPRCNSNEKDKEANSDQQKKDDDKDGNLEIIVDTVNAGVDVGCCCGGGGDCGGSCGGD